MRAFATAPAKTILLGEHFVVYGRPAIVTAIDRKVKVMVEERSDSFIQIHSSLGISGIFEGNILIAAQGRRHVGRTLEPIRVSAQSVLNHLDQKRGLSITIESFIPVAVGLGSSSALAVATVAAVDKLLGAELSAEEVFALSTEAERFVHGNPSGIDQTVSIYGGVLVYQREQRILKLQHTPLLQMVVGNTGESRYTGRLVERVRQRKNQVPKVINSLMETAETLVLEGEECLMRGDLLSFGELMDMNHGLLSSIGVSTMKLDRLVYAAREAGALGAKLTGAGGGGCMVALCKSGERDRVAKAIRNAGGTPFLVEKTELGVEAWLEE